MKDENFELAIANMFSERRREEMNQVKELLRDRLLRMGLISNSKKAHEHALELLAEDIVKFYD